jgi:hypothetical protein
LNNPLSFSSVKLDLFSKEGVRLKSASGFVVEVKRRYYLITNRHVVCTRDMSQDLQSDPAIEPYTLKTTIRIHIGEGEKRAPLHIHAGMRKRITIPLHDSKGQPQWIENQDNLQRQSIVDMVALPIQFDLTLELLSANMPGIYMNKSSWSKLSNYWMKVSAIPMSDVDTDVEYGPPDAVHIIGYPLNWAPDGTDRSSSAFWRTSFIASEIYEPGTIRSDVFFVDPCALEGMTGSPVVGLKNNQIKLLGVYSDHSTAQFSANAGFVWGASLLKELLHTS